MWALAGGSREAPALAGGRSGRRLRHPPRASSPRLAALLHGSWSGSAARPLHAGPRRLFPTVGEYERAGCAGALGRRSREARGVDLERGGWVVRAPATRSDPEIHRQDAWSAGCCGDALCNPGGYGFGADALPSEVEARAACFSMGRGHPSEPGPRRFGDSGGRSLRGNDRRSPRHARPSRRARADLALTERKDSPVKHDWRAGATSAPAL